VCLQTASRRVLRIQSIVNRVNDYMSWVKFDGMSSGAVFHAASRMPINEEIQYIPLTSRFHQTPKWYQFIPRCLLSRPWLKGLLSDEPPYNRPRQALIISDEGGIGKTKAGAIAINHIYSQEPEKPILLLVPRRLIRSWKTELLRVNQKLEGCIFAAEHSSANTLKHPIPGKIYIVSKDSFSKNEKGIFSTWEANFAPNSDIFSLVVIDEAHKGKGDTNQRATLDEGQELETELFGSRMYTAISKLCKYYSSNRLAITASPLSLVLSDLANIGRMIGVDDAFLDVIPATLGHDDEDQFLEQWAHNITEFESICSPLRGEVLDEEALADLHEFFAENEGGFVNQLPHASQIHDAFNTEFSEGWNNYNTRLSWLNELTPLAPFLSIIKREDLGESANQIFRERRTWTEFVPLHEEHMARIGRQENATSIGTGMRQLHEWPTNADPKGFYGLFRDELDFDEHTVHDQIIEPRLRRVLDHVIHEDPVLSGHTIGNKGMLIFCGFKRTVSILQRLLNRQVLIVNGRNCRIKAHAVTGEHPDAISLLNSLSKTEHQSDEIYNIVIGTSAIQEGISMNWASTVVHWDLPPNPQTLEQRTWRLDRHRTEMDSDVFNTVYMVSNTESDLELVRRIRRRALLSDTLLGRNHSPTSWPIPFQDDALRSDVDTRNYHGEQSPFFYDEAKQLADAWKLQTDFDSDEFFIRTEQQKILFKHLFEKYKLPINSEQLLNTGRIEFGEWDSASLDSLQDLMHLAEGSDLIALQKCFPPAPEAMNNFLRIDGFERHDHELRGRRYAISLDPKGALIERVLRRETSNESYAIGPKTAPKEIIFSIERESPMDNLHLDFNFLYRKCFQIHSALLVGEVVGSNLDNVKPLRYSESTLQLMKNIVSSEEESASHTFDGMSPNFIDEACNSFIEAVLSKFDQEMDSVEEQIDTLSSRLDGFEVIDDRTARIHQALEKKQTALQKKLNELEATSNTIRENREGYRPVIRYIQGGI
jgi:hypothetical protein